MFVLFIFHHLLNRNWYSNLFRGKYTPLRILQTAADVLLLAAMIGLMVSGIILSRVVFDFLPISGGMGFARTLHMLALYWGLPAHESASGASLGMIMGMFRKAASIEHPSRIRTWILRVLAVGLCAYGIYAFAKNGIASYMLFTDTFCFL